MIRFTSRDSQVTLRVSLWRKMVSLRRAYVGRIGDLRKGKRGEFDPAQRQINLGSLVKSHSSVQYEVGSDLQGIAKMPRSFPTSQKDRPRYPYPRTATRAGQRSLFPGSAGCPQTNCQDLAPVIPDRSLSSHRVAGRPSCEDNVVLKPRVDRSIGHRWSHWLWSLLTHPRLGC